MIITKLEPKNEKEPRKTA